MSAAASVADWMAWILTLRGSTTPASSMLTTFPVKTSRPAVFSVSWLFLSSTSLSMGLKPAFSARAFGTTSTASANFRTASCSLPLRVAAYSRRRNDSSISGEPPPATSFPSSMASATECIASSIALSRLSSACFVPPRRIMVVAPGFLVSVTKVMTPLPTCLSSTMPASPSSEEFSSSRLVRMLAPVAREILSRSAFFTLLSARIPAFARRCWAMSSIPF